MTTESSILINDTDSTQIAQWPAVNLELRGYEVEFAEWLKGANGFTNFKKRITDELNRLGFSDWAYSRIDVPPTHGISEQVGTAREDEMKLYLAESFGDCDLMFMHASRAKSHIYQSTVEALVNNREMPQIEILERNRDLLKLLKSINHYEYLAIPLGSKEKDNHAVFTLAARKVCSNDFKKNVNTNIDKLKIIIRLVESIGIECYPGYLLGAVNKIQKSISKESIRLLSIMAINDLKIDEAANTLQITRNVADKHLGKIRDFFDVNTTHSAIIKAIKGGFIDIHDRSLERNN